MRITATVLVNATEGSKPDPARVEEAARLLARSGIDVLRIGRFGVSVEAESEVFARVLGVTPVPDGHKSYPVDPAEPALRDLLDSVELNAPPRTY